MFTKGQLIFGVIFFIVFVISIFYTYKKDFALHKKYYNGSIWVLVAFIAFLLFIISIKLIFKG
nr:hypothetical protein [Formosa sp. L2A11]